MMTKGSQGDEDKGEKEILESKRDGERRKEWNGEKEWMKEEEEEEGKGGPRSAGCMTLAWRPLPSVGTRREKNLVEAPRGRQDALKISLLILSAMITEI